MRRDDGRYLLTLTVLALAVAALLPILAGCSGWQSPVYPVTPPAPAPVDPVEPGPSPVDPVQPGPVDPAPAVQEVAHALASQVRPGMTLAAVEALVGSQANHKAQRDDGTTGALWATTDAAGRKAWLSVIFGVDGLSRPHALIPREPPR